MPGGTVVRNMSAKLSSRASIAALFSIVAVGNWLRKIDARPARTAGPVTPRAAVPAATRLSPERNFRLVRLPASESLPSCPDTFPSVFAPESDRGRLRHQRSLAPAGSADENEALDAHGVASAARTGVWIQSRA